MTEKKPSKFAATNPLWGGRFASGPGALMEQMNTSIDFDKALYAQDIAGSRAHCTMLASVGILSENDCNAILKGLDFIKAEIEAGEFAYSPALEDIHMHIESRLIELAPDPGARLHTARSRNDQVATDFRLWVRDAIDRLDPSLRALQSALIDQAQTHAASVLPGLTHMQPAQAVTLGHHLLAYVEMLGRDRGRLADCRARVNESPLGAAALAGTSFPIDPAMTATALGFDGPMANSMDAVSARDFALEFLAAAAIAATHLSRLAEELVMWASPRFGFVTLDDAFSTGSSIMPQKRNPDAAELVRGKAGRIIGALNGLMIVLKGLPLAYSKDLQEDKEPVFAAAGQLDLCIVAMTGMIAGMTVNTQAMRAACDDGFLTATDLADWLVRTLNMPFRHAHAVTGRVVKLAEERGSGLADLSLADLQSIELGITEDVFSVLGIEESAASRTSPGGTAPDRVRAAAALARTRLTP